MTGGALPDWNAPVEVLVTGGTIDKSYHPILGRLEVSEPFAAQLFGFVGRMENVDIRPILAKDSLDFDDRDRRIIHDAVANSSRSQIIVTHGTDTMSVTARSLGDITDKTIVLTGAMIPGRFQGSDAGFNLGYALAMVQTLSSGIYLAMHGRVFAPDRVLKNRDLGRFEDICSDI